QRTRPNRSWPCTPHHNLGVMLLMTQKNRKSAVVRFGEFRVSTPGTRFIRCLNSVTSRNGRINVLVVLHTQQNHA
ncbi:TPA: hypothetical protein HMV23_24485, partial [Escherichia coli]|nr:hypothetical protein [Escherichia coli]